MVSSRVLVLPLVAGLPAEPPIFDMLKSSLGDNVQQAPPLSACPNSSPAVYIDYILRSFDSNLIMPVLDSAGVKHHPGFVKAILSLENRRNILTLACDRHVPKVLKAFPGLLKSVILPPLLLEKVVPRVLSLLGLHKTVSPESESALYPNERAIIGTSPEFLKILQALPRIASAEAGILIEGETGTGKEIVARYIHSFSRRCHAPFIAVNCGAIPPDLLENELFGHHAGAYTSASTNQIGLVAEAEGGTLFLDEVNSLTPSSQGKLLRLIQEKEYKPLGSSKTLKADFRIVCASNANLKREVEKGHFRQDLFYRINVISLYLPPLRKRPEDIETLASHFLRISALKAGKQISGYTPEVLSRMLAYDWPGNVRELQSVVEGLVVNFEGATSLVDDVHLPHVITLGAHSSLREMKKRVVAALEVSFVQNALTASGGNISQAAAAVGSDRRSFWELIRKHRIRVDQFRTPK